MNAPERVLKTINHEEPDRVPAFESAFTNNTIMKHYGFEPRPIPTQKIPDKVLKQVIENPQFIESFYKKYYEFCRKAGLDLVTSIVSLFPRTFLDEEKSVDEYGRIMRGEVYEKDGTVITGYVGGHFKSFEDFENWEPLDPHWEARLNHFKVGRKIQEELNNEIFSIPAVGSLMECSWESFGLETFSRILARPKQAKKVFDSRGEFTLEVVKILAENEAQLILLWDDYGFKNGLFMSPRNYRKYVFPWIKKICNAAHKQDCKILLHSDGDLIEIFEDIIDCGVDVLNPVESTTANPEYDIFKLNEKYGDKISFAGNLSPIMLALGEISEIEDYAKRLIREVAPGGGYIFSSGHSINPAVTLDRFEAMQNIKRKYGTYPINVPD
jgi:uroporphyrinogen decarboxylase